MPQDGQHRARRRGGSRERDQGRPVYRSTETRCDLQYVLFNFLAIGCALALFIRHPAHGLPAIPPQLAGLTGISAAAYVTNKASANTRATLSAVSPTHAHVKEDVTVHGTNLVPQGGRAGSTEILVNGLRATKVGTPSSEKIIFTVPPCPGVVGGAWPFPYDAAKAVDITVTTAAGQQAVLPAALHLYQADRKNA
ncbi:IPT/TIG domain-containing protein [Streptomyces sp. NPDC057257]|uniref:IPT/TIG domain-containing protein n=1 Tax=Streptomyces sp. NPDC057257 TaxID=3346071 RepID=UPI00362604F7